MACTLIFLVTPFLTYGDETGQSTGKGQITGDIFGKTGGYFHPFLSVQERYEDNIFNTPDNEKSDYITTISPGIWLALPGTKKPQLDISTSTFTPGGVVQSRFRPETFRRYQTYLLYSAGLEKYADFSEQDITTHKLEGLFEYNFRGGLSIDLFDQFYRARLPQATLISTELDKYKTNLFDVTLSFDVTEKLGLRADYSNYNVNYDAVRNNAFDRTDNSLSGYIFFKFRPKTSVFVEYEFIDINYDRNILSDSAEQRFFGGIRWGITGKSAGSVKAGYGIREFDDPTIANDSEFVFEVQADHQFTPKTSLSLFASRRNTESTTTTTDYAVAHNVGIGYAQKLTYRITGRLNLAYWHYEYIGALTYGGETKERTDNEFRAAPSLEYRFRDWLWFGVEYIYTKRDSNFPGLDYTNHAGMIRVTLAL